VIGAIVAGARVGEDRKPSAIEDQPVRDLAEEVGWDGQLTASTRMRADRANMQMPHRNAESGANILAKIARQFELVRIEINVGVEVGDRVGVWHYRLR
jgi:hypothetical protein